MTTGTEPDAGRDDDMTSYRIKAGQYESTLEACGVALGGYPSVDEAISACSLVCGLGDDPVIVEGGDDEHYVYCDQDGADADQDGSRAVVVVVGDEPGDGR